MTCFVKCFWTAKHELSETEWCRFQSRGLPAMNAIKKKITWYKYANINKVIRKPPIMKNMPLKKLFSVHLVGETDAGKRACVSVTLYLLRRRGRLVSITLYFAVYIYLLCWNQTQSHPALDHEDGGSGPKAGEKKVVSWPPLPPTSPVAPGDAF